MFTRKDYKTGELIITSELEDRAEAKADLLEALENADGDFSQVQDRIGELADSAISVYYYQNLRAVADRDDLFTTEPETYDEKDLTIGRFAQLVCYTRAEEIYREALEEIKTAQEAAGDLSAENN